jgi:tellurite methyltransferase
VSRSDRRRWDEKWNSAGEPYAVDRLLTENEVFFEGGLALDLACGRGQNTIWLARHGYRVLGVDGSWVALSAARRAAVAQEVADRSWFVQVDLDAWLRPVCEFDLVCVIRFLDRRLFPFLRQGVRVGGVIAYTTRHSGLCLREPTANRAYLLQPGELAEAFADWRILFHRLGAVDEALIARRV